MRKPLIIICLLAVLCADVMAQEAVAPLGYRPPTSHDEYGSPNTASRAVKKGTVATLPFFEDFTSDTFYPDTTLWLDRKVYINNTLCKDQISRGVATFDAMDEDGLPYEKTNNTVLRYADSLTSQKLDLSAYSVGDSVYLSFFYQPEGNGFAPEMGDSLMLYFKHTNGWTRVWRTAGTGVHDFKQVMILLNQATFFHNEFQFRFVNKASISNSDDVWSVDYIRLDANRSMSDTVLSDVAYTVEPTFLLNDYTYMPYHQYLANAGGERSNQHEVVIRNNNPTSVNVNYGYNATELTTSTPLATGSNSVSIAPLGTAKVSFSVYSSTISNPVNNDLVYYENKYYIQSGAGTGSLLNDTIIKKQFFHNYLAYDDGTPEKSYYLKLFPTLPGKLAIEYKLNVPDTLKGIAIYFGRQVPLAYQKYFSLTVYKDIAYVGGSDVLLYQEDFLIPNYLSHNRFWYYKFQKPVVLPAGTFYIGTIQPALSGSDSLYFGLDVNRVGTNHVFYNVLNNWEGSTVDGAVMMRPLFGEFFPSVIKGVVPDKPRNYGVSPNPAKGFIRINYNSSDEARYTITDMLGRVRKEGATTNDAQIDIKDFVPGVYLVYFTIDGQTAPPQKIIKQ
ncbi:MAG: T9SS type A sorting domain-containing protein [Chitinophagales bacterium]|nr:T9SS type A sorting domain-containing protein [Chitinophagaceae bacterium]MCB9064214.1 T9SS type A sorting domain-containing protein [Chitinophagales bacterium]